MLRLRKSKLLPQQVSDLGAFIFVTLMIPVTYIWEVCKLTLTIQQIILVLFKVAVVSQSLFPKDSISWYFHMFFGLVRSYNLI